ncbi:MAG: hypothetical protein KDC26_08325 [Armatimonadetes bacterium]|nr:hypothetical protein [Armatimonadota bacterium]
MSKVELKLVGGFSLTINGEVIDFKLSSAAKVLARVALEPNGKMLRTVLADEIWPEGDSAKKLSRLRVALSEISKNNALEPFVTITNREVEFCVTEPDVNASRELLDAAALAEDEAKHLALIQEHISRFDGDLVPEWDDDWLAPFRRTWKRNLNDRDLKLCEILGPAVDVDRVTEALRRVVARSPENESAWERLIRIESDRRNHIEVTDEFDEARYKLEAESGASFSKDLLSYAKMARRGTLHSDYNLTVLRTEAEEVLLNGLARMKKSDPVKYMEILSHAALNVEAYQRPTGYNELAEEILAAVIEPGAERNTVVLFNAMAYSVLHQSSDSEKRLRELVTYETDARRLSSAYNSLSFDCFVRRDYDQAYQYSDLSIKFAIEEGNDFRIKISRHNRASYDWHRGFLDEALAVYQTEDYSLASEFERDRFKMVNNGNSAFVYFYKNDYELAEEHFLLCREYAEKANYPVFDTMGASTLGACQVILGRKKKGIENIIIGLGSSYRKKDFRAYQISLDAAARGLGELGLLGEAVSVLEWSRQLRADHNHPWSVAELVNADIVKELTQHKSPMTAWMSLPSQSALINKIAAAFRTVS